MSNDHAVIILASGLSQRLDQCKQLLSKQGEPLIRSMIKLALATQPNAVIVVIPKDNPKIAAAIAKLVTQELRIHTVVNPTPETGMAHSLYLGIEALTNLENTLSNTFNNIASKQVLIMGIDQVLLDSKHLTNLLAGTRSVTASRYCFLNKQNSNDNLSDDESKKNIVGLPIVIDYERLKQWQSVLVGDKGLRQLIRALPPNQISIISNQQLSYDIDTPNQLAHAQEQNWIDH